MDDEKKYSDTYVGVAAAVFLLIGILIGMVTMGVFIVALRAG